jgi:hypothetical protein
MNITQQVSAPSLDLDEQIALYFLIQSEFESRKGPEAKLAFFGAECPPTVAALTKGRDGDPRRDLFELFKVHASVEFRPQERVAQGLRNILARSSLFPVNFLQCCFVLSKSYRIRYFDLAESLLTIEKGKRYLIENETLLTGNGDRSRFLIEMRWKLGNEFVHTCIYLRLFDQARKAVKENCELASGLSERERLLASVGAAFLEFMAAYQGGMVFFKAKELLRECRKQANAKGIQSLADHIELYEAFCNVFPRVSSEMAEVLPVFERLTGSEYLLVKCFSRLGAAACCHANGDHSTFQAWFKEYRSFLENRNDKSETVFEFRNKNRAVPFFYLLEQELALHYDGHDIDEAITTVRKHADASVRSFERILSVRHRMAFAPQVYDYFRMLLRLCLQKLTAAGMVDNETIRFMTIFMEKGRRASALSWYTEDDVFFDTACEDPIASILLENFERPREKPVMALIERSKIEPDSRFVFLTDRPEPFLIWYQNGKQALIRAESVNDAIEQFIQASNPQNTGEYRRIYLFIDAHLAETLGGPCEKLKKASGNTLLLYAEDLIRFVRKQRWEIKAKAKYLVLYSRYDSAADTMDNAIDKSIVLIDTWCNENEIALEKREIINKDGVKGFFDSVAKADIVHVFCHGEHGTSPLQQRLRFNDFTITLADLYENKNAVAGKAFCLCACRSGSDSSKAHSEHISFASVLAAMGALIAYAPLESPFVRDLPERTEEFLDILEGKPVLYSSGWRAVV